MINTIEYKNNQREEVIKYYFSKKGNYITKDLFFQKISELENFNIIENDFKESDLEIPLVELNCFFKDGEIKNHNIIDYRSFEEDWNLINTFLETDDYFIIRFWSTTA